MKKAATPSTTTISGNIFLRGRGDLAGAAAGFGSGCCSVMFLSLLPFFGGGGETYPIVVRRQSEHETDQLTEAVVNRPHGLVDHAGHRGSWLGEFVHHQLEVPSGAIGPAYSQEHGMDQFAKGRFWRGRAAERLVDDSVSRSPDRMPQDFGVQLQLVAEVIVHQRDV